MSFLLHLLKKYYRLIKKYYNQISQDTYKIRLGSSHSIEKSDDNFIKMSKIQDSLMIWITLVLPAGTFMNILWLLTFKDCWLIISKAEYLSKPNACKSNETIQSASILPLFRMVKNNFFPSPNLSILMFFTAVVA